MTNSELHIHGHSCLEIRTNNLSLVCDPWLSGSAYWRSWWNFPESKDFNSLLDIWCKQKISIFILLICIGIIFTDQVLER